MNTGGPPLSLALRGRIGQLAIEVEFAVESTRPTVIIGPNGAGKTTLLLMTLGTVVAESGRVMLDGQILFQGRPRRAVPVEDRRMGYVPQRYALFPHLTVLENVAYGIRPIGAVRGQRRKAGARALLEELGVSSLADRRSSSLSGGEAQRVALARALAARPRALLLDEPLAALDAELRPDVRTFLAETLRKLAIPTIVVTHDFSDARAFAGDMLVLEEGKVVQRGSMSALIDKPATPFVRRFVGQEIAPAPPA